MMTECSLLVKYIIFIQELFLEPKHSAQCTAHLVRLPVPVIPMLSPSFVVPGASSSVCLRQQQRWQH